MSTLIYLGSSTSPYGQLSPVLASVDYFDSMGDKMFSLGIVYDMENSPLKRNKFSGKEWFSIFKRIVV